MYNNINPPNLIFIRVYGVVKSEMNGYLVSDEYINGQKITKFIGGGLEVGEGTIACLVREFKEETNLDVTVGEHIYTTDYYQQSAFNSNLQIISIYYWVNINEPFDLEISNNPFDFSLENTTNPLIGLQSFRWIPSNNLKVEDFQLPIDKIVAKILMQ